MKRPPARVVSLVRFFIITVILGEVFFSAGAVRAQFASAGPIMVRSVSGQFIVTAESQFSPLLHNPDLATNASYLRLEPALLAISAERFKGVVWDQLGLKPDAPWSGKIFLALHPARTPEDAPVLTVGPFLKSWSCRVELPDVVTLARYGRSLSAALLLELASRNQADASRVPEIPGWLADGLAQMTYAKDTEQVALSLPAHTLNGLSQKRIDKHERGMDVYAAARLTLQDSPVLTFDQLCWPDDGQINGRDGGLYLASAQIFTGELLGLKNGLEKMRNFLAALPGCYNWQTAFFKAFGENFTRPLEVEKWWLLRVVHFTAQAPGPHWTATVSRDRLAALLSVPVEYRSRSNSLPTHMQVSLQSAIQSFSPAQQSLVLETKLRDLQMAQFRLAQPFARLAGGYAAALADFLGVGQKPVFPAGNKQVVNTRHAASMAETVKKLNALDGQRRDAETKLKPAHLLRN